MSYNKPIRHGDVDIIPIESIPEKSIIKKDNMVMHGENGHSHTLVNGQILINEGQKYIQADQNTYLIHQEHRKTVIPSGSYIVKQETEYDPFTSEIMRVRD